MSVFNVPLGMSVNDNPIVDSPFVAQFDIGIAYPPINAQDILTENGFFILTENGDFIATE